jgi:hypothetical protein
MGKLMNAVSNLLYELFFYAVECGSDKCCDWQLGRHIAGLTG